MGLDLPRGRRVQGDAACADCGEAFRVDTGPTPWVPAERWARAVLVGETPGYCPPCSERREAAAERRAEESYNQDLRAGRLDRSGIPSSLRVSFESVDRLENDVRGRATAAAQEWARSGGGLVLTGVVGVGKTYIAGAAATEATRYRRVRWLSAARLLQDLSSGFGTPAHERATRSLDPRGRPALILDDLDKTRATEFALTPFFLAIDTWMVEGLPLLITMNRDLDELERDWGTFGAPIASRLEGYCKIGRLEGRDRRAAP